MQKQNLRWSSLILSSLLVATLSGCEAIQLLSSVNDIVQPNADGSVSLGTPNAQTNTNGSTAPQPQAPTLEVVSAEDTSPLSKDWNMVRQPGIEINVSSTLNATFDKKRLIDGKLTTSWFTAAGDAASQGKLPTIEITFPKPIGILGVNLRGDRERSAGLPIQELSLLISSAKGILLNETVFLPSDTGTDFNIVLKKPIDNASSLRLTFTKDSNASPGLSEIEVLGRQ